MSNQPSGYWCTACDRAQTPTRLVKQTSGKTEGMLLRCPTCGRVYPYSALSDLTNPNRPRMDKIEFVEKQPAGYITIPLWLHPEVAEALKQKFPSNWQTTLSSAVTALADPDAVLIEGEYAREMAAIGVRKGREVLSLAREVKELREQVAAARLREETLRQFFGSMGMMMPQPISQAGGQVAGQSTAPAPASPLDAQGNPLTPPHAQFAQLRDDGNGLLVPADGSEQLAPSQFAFPAGGVAPAADGRPAFVTTNLR